MPPEALPEALAAGAARLRVALTPRQLQLFADYARLLLRWNAVHNLTAIRGEGELLTHHLLDSLALLPHWPAPPEAGAPQRALDVGSGGGLPGIALAIALPHTQVTLLDAVQKKCAFLTQVRLQLGLGNVEVVHGRVESMHAPRFDVIVSRALTTLAQFTDWTRHLVKPAGCWLAMKGQLPADEIAALAPDLQATVIPLSVPGLDEARHLVVLRNR